MTGYGRGDTVLDGRSLVVELRAVNNRYLDCTVKLPGAWRAAEDTVRAQVQGAVHRGKVEVFINLSTGTDAALAVSVNRPVADQYFGALCTLRDSYMLQDDISVALLSRFPDVFTVERVKEDAEQVKAAVSAALGVALTEFDAMRAAEGLRLRQDILVRADRIAELVTEVEQRAPGIVADYRARLEAKLREVLEQQVEESRILTEAAVFADRVAYDEETVRLRSHLSQLRDMLDDGGPMGRKLDFLLQELNREVNTIGSKCSDLEGSRLVVEMKAELEKMREQVQNIE